jgi:hypothetical protein
MPGQALLLAPRLRGGKLGRDTATTNHVIPAGQRTSTLKAGIHLSGWVDPRLLAGKSEPAGMTGY